MDSSLHGTAEGTARPHRKGGRYCNPHQRGSKRRWWHLLLWRLGYYNDREPYEGAPADFTYPQFNEPLVKGEPTITWINHTTFLMSVDGLNILTDPVWSSRCSPVDFIGPLRKHAPPATIEQLPPLHYILISHNHYDHLDKKTVEELNRRHPQTQWLVPMGLKRWFVRRGVQHVTELDWWESHHLPNIQFHFVPAQHYSGRGMFDFNRSLWGGWVVRVKRRNLKTKTFYFVGDTGYNSVDFKEIGARFPQIDLSLVPIGVYRPVRFMSTVHASPLEAVQIHLDVGSALSIGTHWNTFNLSSEPRHQPPFDLYKSMLEKELPFETFRVLEPGQTINW